MFPVTIKSPLTVKPVTSVNVASNVFPELSNIVNVLLEYVNPVVNVLKSVNPVTSIVKLGYVPVTLILVPLFRTTVWSGSVFIIIMSPVVVSADNPVPVVNEFT